MKDIKMKKYSKAIKDLTEKDFLAIATDIKIQLKNLSKKGKYYDDLVNEYLYLLNVRETLKKDIQTKGVRYEFVNGNGKTQEKPNESVVNLIKIEQIMLKIFADLQLNQAFSNNSNNSTDNLKGKLEDYEEDLL